MRASTAISPISQNVEQVPITPDSFAGELILGENSHFDAVRSRAGKAFDYLGKVPGDHLRTATAFLATGALALAGAVELASNTDKAHASPSAKAAAGKVLAGKSFTLRVNALPATATVANAIQSGAPDSTIGAAFANSIPGYSTDFKQRTLSVTRSLDGPEAQFQCPPPRSKNSAISIQSMKLLPDKMAKVTFCPSNKVLNIAPIDLKKPVNKKALDAYEADPVRNQEWGGDLLDKRPVRGHGWNLFFICPDIISTARYNLKSSLKFKPSKNSISVGINEGSYFPFCDRVQQTTKEVTAQASLDAKQQRFKQEGNSVLHMTGQKEILTTLEYMPSLKSEKNIEFTVPNVSNLCKGRKEPIAMRLKIREESRGMQTQTFKRSPVTRTGKGMRSTTATYFSEPQIIPCK